MVSRPDGRRSAADAELLRYRIMRFDWMFSTVYSLINVVLPLVDMKDRHNPAYSGYLCFSRSLKIVKKEDLKQQSPLPNVCNPAVQQDHGVMISSLSLTSRPVNVTSVTAVASPILVKFLPQSVPPL